MLGVLHNPCHCTPLHKFVVSRNEKWENQFKREKKAYSFGRHELTKYARKENIAWSKLNLNLNKRENICCLCQIEPSCPSLLYTFNGSCHFPSTLKHYICESIESKNRKYRIPWGDFIHLIVSIEHNHTVLSHHKGHPLCRPCNRNVHSQSNSILSAATTNTIH